MTNRNEYDILIDMNKELGKQQVLTMVLTDLSALSYTEKYKQYQKLLEESNTKYDKLKTEYNNTINKQQHGRSNNRSSN
jgi:C4-type Zn-finger protein